MIEDQNVEHIILERKKTLNYLHTLRKRAAKDASSTRGLNSIL